MTPSRLHRFFPFLLWLPGYDRESLKADLIAGMTVALVLVPQSMAYAQLAGLPAYYGLYASFLPPMVAALFGSSRRLATGPVAVVSIMTAASLEPLAISGSSQFISYAILLSFLVGIFQLLLGVLRLGFIVNLLSHPVIVGFTNAAALIIGASQLSRLLGIHVDKGDHFYETMLRMSQAAADFIHWPSLAMAVMAMAVMITLKKYRPSVPSVLVAVILTTCLAWLTGFENNRVVSLKQVEVKKLPELIVQLNASLEHIHQTRIARNQFGDEQAHPSNRNQVCRQCHPNRDMDLNRLKYADRKQKSSTMSLENVLELHFMAGVLDQYIDGEKNLAHSIRKQIRSLHLIAVRDKTGGITYRRAREISTKKELESTLWRIKIGQGRIDPEHLLLMGGGEVIGAVPHGLPPLASPQFNWKVLWKLMTTAVVISILGFMEAISIAKAIAARTGCKLDPDQELIGQGLANLVGSFSTGYPVSGSFSRSAVNYQAGARSGLSSVFTSLMVLATLLFLTPLLYHLPQSVLAAIIIMAVTGLFNVREIRHAWRVQKSDGIISIITFVTTLGFAPHLDRGILLGVGLSVAIFFYRKMKPVIVELSLWEDGHFRNVDRFGLRQCPYIVLIRFDGPLFFANINYLEEEVFRIVAGHERLQIIHFKCNGINEIDASGERSLRLLVARLRAGGYEVYFSGLKIQVVDVLRESGLLEEIGEDHLFPTLAQALETIWPRVHQPEDTARCPLKRVVKK